MSEINFFIGKLLQRSLILSLTLFLGVITSCDFKHSIQHQLGFETTNNQNISKTTIEQDCGDSAVSSSSVQYRDKSTQSKDKNQLLFHHKSLDFKLLVKKFSCQPNTEDQSFNRKHCPLFILYKKRKVIASTV
ncbi:MAG: hypothetical protein WEA99_01830 [Brumimicrobium sp.]